MDNSFATTYDYIVIGAGSAGCAVASRLAETGGNRVLLLEAGGTDQHFLVRLPLGFQWVYRNPAYNWNYESEPEPSLGDRKIFIPRGKLLGGSSSINGMLHIRGRARDFEEWRSLGNEGWGYRDVLPYFRRSESDWRGEGPYHGGSGPLQVRPVDMAKIIYKPLHEAAINAGYAFTEDFDGADQEGFGNAQFAIDQRGRRHSAYRAYFSAKRRFPNIEIQTKATVQRLLFQDKTAVGVEYAHKGKTIRARVEKEIVLSAGTYNTPKLLMLSGIGPRQELAKFGLPCIADLAGVGQNLVEHPSIPVIFQASQPVTFANELRLDKAIMSVLRWAILGSGTFATQICNGTLLARTRPELSRPDIELTFAPVGVDANVWFPGLIKSKPHSFFARVCLLHQGSRGHVTLRSTNPSDPPRIFLNLLSDPEDARSLRDGIRAARAIYRTAPMSDFVGSETMPGHDASSDEKLDAYLRQWLGITQHPVGTCRMGQDEYAVVDAKLRVHGIDGLRIADASIMPTILGANINATTVMIGDRAADFILNRGRRPAEI